MIQGVVTAVREAVVELTVIGTAGRSQRISFIVDTGFDGGITLPSSIAAELELRTEGVAVTTLGDGSKTDHEFSKAVVLWNGVARSVLVDIAETDPLLGMRLLAGHLLRIEVNRYVEVSIIPLHQVNNARSAEDSTL